MAMAPVRMMLGLLLPYMFTPLAWAVVTFPQSRGSHQPFSQPAIREAFLERVRRLARTRPAFPDAAGPMDPRWAPMMAQGHAADGLMRREAVQRNIPPTQDQQHHWFGPGHSRQANLVEQVGVERDGEIASRLPEAGQMMPQMLAPDQAFELGQAQIVQPPPGNRGERMMRRHSSRQLGAAESPDAGSRAKEDIIAGVAKVVAPVQYFVVVPITMGSAMWTTAIVALAALAAYFFTRGAATDALVPTWQSEATASKGWPCRCTRRLWARDAKGKMFDSGDSPKAGSATCASQEADDSSDDDSLPRPDLTDDLDAYDEPEPEMEALVAGLLAETQPSVMTTAGLTSAATVAFADAVKPAAMPSDDIAPRDVAA